MRGFGLQQRASPKPSPASGRGSTLDTEPDDPVFRTALRRRRHRRLLRVRDLLATVAGAYPRSSPGPAERTRRRRVRAALGLGLAAAARLPGRKRRQPQRPGQSGADLVADDHRRPRLCCPALAAFHGDGMNDHDQWWLATIGRTVIWARLRVLDAGTAEVLDSDGVSQPYDSEDTARAALMDAEFVSLDGLDDEDARDRGFALDELVPPHGDDDELLRGQMVQKLPSRH